MSPFSLLKAEHVQFCQSLLIGQVFQTSGHFCWDVVLEESAHISPLSLPDYASPVGTYCTVMGWGSITTSPDTYPNVPHCVSIKMLKNHFCQDAYPWWSMTDNMFCAGFLEGEKDSCRVINVMGHNETPFGQHVYQ
uniref:Peptidase S1 domain-containing protein n=1 Tax=Varanus komodoensis TaxID=61221 RepID=A0A8D2ITR2_VARKO